MLPGKTFPVEHLSKKSTPCWEVDEILPNLPPAKYSDVKLPRTKYPGPQTAQTIQGLNCPAPNIQTPNSTSAKYSSPAPPIRHHTAQPRPPRPPPPSPACVLPCARQTTVARTENSPQFHLEACFHDGFSYPQYRRGCSKVAIVVGKRFTSDHV